MTNREAIDILNPLRAVREEYGWQALSEEAEALGVAIEALKRGVPARPYTHVIEYRYKPDDTVVQCPACLRRLRTRRTMAKGDQFCPSCGQAIDWEGIDG